MFQYITFENVTFDKKSLVFDRTLTQLNVRNLKKKKQSDPKTANGQMCIEVFGSDVKHPNDFLKYLL